MEVGRAVAGDRDDATHPRQPGALAGRGVVVARPLLEIGMRGALDDDHAQPEARDHDPADRRAFAKRGPERDRACAQERRFLPCPVDVRDDRDARRLRPPVAVDLVEPACERLLLVARVERRERVAPRRGDADPGEQEHAEAGQHEPPLANHLRA